MNKYVLGTCGHFAMVMIFGDGFVKPLWVPEVPGISHNLDMLYRCFETPVAGSLR